ncbi:MAG: hypothetical protein AAFQ14_05790 [Cyanobacteria bacterium J06621_12]
MYSNCFAPIPTQYEGIKEIYVTEDPSILSTDRQTEIWTETDIAALPASQKIIHSIENATVYTFSSHAKNLDSILERDTSSIPQNIIVIGGGATINKSLYLAGEFPRKDISITLVPTTVLAMADVAIGSKGIIDALEKQTSENHIVPQKNYFRRYVNPDTVLLEPEFIESLPNIQKKHGLSECLKHGLMQDKDLYEICLNLLSERDLDSQTTYNAALRTMELKAAVLAVDPFEEDYGQVLSYGHLSAHSIEKAHHFSVPHGRSVLWGCLLDLHLAGNQTIYQELADCLREGGVLELTDVDFTNSQFSQLIEPAHNTDHKPFHFNSDGKFQIIKLDTVGQYALPQPLTRIPLEFPEIKASLEAVSTDLMT